MAKEIVGATPLELLLKDELHEEEVPDHPQPDTEISELERFMLCGINWFGAPYHWLQCLHAK